MKIFKTACISLATTILLTTIAWSMEASPIVSLLNLISTEIGGGALNQISHAQHNEIEVNLQNTLRILRGQDPNSHDVICKVSSNHSSYFRLFNGRLEIGGNSNKDECFELRNQARGEIVCARSLNHSSYFRIYTIQSAQSLGGDTSEINCQRMISTATRQYVCAVSTNHSSYFSIYNLKTSESISGDMSLDDCIRSINNQ